MEKFKKARTLNDIKNHPLMDRGNGDAEAIWSEGDLDGTSYWGAVKAGYQVYGNEQHIIHEPTIKAFCDVLNDAEEWTDDPELKL